MIPKNELRKRGRPKGTLKKRHFVETRLGFFLRYEAPIEYSVIMVGQPKVFPEPDIVLIEAVASISDDESFNKKKFKKYLDEYRNNGIYAERAKVLTPDLEKYYKDLRKNKSKRFYKVYKNKR